MRNEVHSTLEQKLQKTIEHFKTELQSVRAGRANPAILDRIFVDYYGTQTPLKQMATVSAPEPRLITISPFDRSMISGIEKAIQQSDLGLNPSNDGKMIRLNLPMLTEENRKNLTKVVKKLGEETKVAARNERRTAIDVLKKMEKDGEVTEDQLSGFEKEVQQMLDKAILDIDKMVDEKHKEIMEV